MIAHPDGRRWIGYRAGTHIADQAIAAPGTSSGALAGVDAEEVLRRPGITI